MLYTFVYFRILDSLDSIAFNLPLSDGEAVIVQSTVAISAQEIVPINFNGLNLAVSTTTDGTLDENSLSTERDSTASVIVPDNLLSGVPNAERIAFGVQTNPAFFIQSLEIVQRTPVSVILSLDVYSDEGKEAISNLQPGITFSFSLPDSLNVLCTYWDDCKFNLKFLAFIIIIITIFC